MRQGLDSLRANRSSVVIAHRLIIIRIADVICVLDHGELFEQGTHELMLAKGGRYARLQSRKAKA